MSRRRKIAYFCLILILVLVMIISGLQILKSTVFHSQPTSGERISQKTIVRDGVEYYPRQDLTVMMVLGIDQFGPVQASKAYTNPGAADMVMLLIFDETNRECTVLYLNRDTMLDVSVLGVRGEPAGTYYAQLALAHTYGTGMADSCENTRQTLESFLPGLTVDHYIAMNMDAIPILNDAVGGVTVNVVDDFSQVDDTIPMGQVTLKGNQVLSYVRIRKDVGDQKNVTRMERQKEYINNFLDRFRYMEQQNVNFFVETFEQVSPYIVTDCTVNTLSGMLSRYQDYSLKEFVTPEGENVVGDEYYEFYPDEEKLDQLILRLFYAEK